MEIVFLGLGSAFNPEMKNTNAFFALDNHLYIIDCGESAFEQLWKLRELESCPVITAVITHLHCDHVGSLGSLISYSYYVLGKKIRVVHPLETVVHLLDLTGIERSCYEYLPRLERGPGEPAGFEAVEVEHVDNMTCYGYLISDGKERVYYSGDAKFIPSPVKDAFINNEIDRIYQDTSLKASDHMTHGTLDYLEVNFPPALRDRIYCMHLDCDFRQKLNEKGFSAGKLFEVREELKVCESTGY